MLMAKKLKPTLVVAGPGAGKTFHIINKIKEKVHLLDAEKYLAVITYTNAATLEIKERLSKQMELPPNVFIGTIHSFIIRFILKPYARQYDFLPEEVVYKNIEVKTDDFKERNFITSRIVNKGIVPYDKIISLSNKIIEENKKVIRSLISNRLQYLFVDEFQDADAGQFKVFEQIRIAGMTKMYYVGDPEQSIMSFQSKGRKRPTMDKRTISKAINSTMINKQYLNSNNRSSKTIVDFLNNFHSMISQKHCNHKNNTQNKVIFINSISILPEIVKQFNLLCEDKDYCEKIPENKLFLAYEGKTYKGVADEFGLIQRNAKSFGDTNLLKECTDFVCDILNRGKNSIMKEIGIDDLKFRMKCLNIISRIKENTTIKKYELIDLVKSLFKGISYDSVHNRDKIKNNSEKVADDFIKKVNFELQHNTNENNNSFYQTIHSAKGLEADAVLIIAKSKSELKKWLEVDKDKRMKDKNDTCRIGYVGFSRAREFLCIACLEPIDKDLMGQLVNLNVNLI